MTDVQISLKSGSLEEDVRVSISAQIGAFAYDDFLTSGLHSDVTLVASSGERVSAHKVVLAAVFPLLRDVLAEAECDEGFTMILLPDTNFEEVQTLLEILYGAKDVSEEALDQLLRSWSHFVRRESDGESVIERKRKLSWNDGDEVKLEVIPEFHDSEGEDDLGTLNEIPERRKRIRLKEVDDINSASKKSRDLPCIISIDKAEDGKFICPEEGCRYSHELRKYVVGHLRMVRKRDRRVEHLKAVC